MGEAGSLAQTVGLQSLLSPAAVDEAVQVELIGEYAGEVSAVAVAGKNAYIGFKKNLVILDISDPGRPLFVGQTVDLPDVIQDIAILGSRAYLADGAGYLIVIDITNPDAPVVAYSVKTIDSAYGVEVSGNYAYIADYAYGLSIVDLANANLMGSCRTSGTAYDVALMGNYTLVADGFGGLQIIDITVPTAPDLIATQNTPGSATGVAVFGSIAYVADGDGGLRIIDVSVPTKPAEVGYLKTPDFAQAVVISGDYAYVADRGGGLRVINIYKPTSPYEVGYFRSKDDARKVVYSNDYVYVADHMYGLVILRPCIVPAAPVKIDPLDGSTHAADNTPTFSWNAANDANDYQLQVDDDSDFSSPVVNTTTLGTSYTPATALNNATYYWRVRGRDTVNGCNCYGAFSSTWSLIIAVPPVAFGKTAPANGALGLPHDLIPFSWQTSTWATAYQFCFDTSNDNTCASWNDVGTSTAFYWDGSFNYATTYYWQARACNTICTDADSNTWWSFTTNDQYEDDDNSDQATLVTPGVTLHSITPAGDVDWIKFMLDRELAVFIRTSGVGTPKTDMSLFSSSDLINPIEFNDGDGHPFSYIDRACGIDPLPPGTYYVKIEERGNDGVIPVYNLSLTTWGCRLYLPLVLKDYKPFFEGPFEMEDNDSPAQANGPLRSGQDYQGYPDDDNDYFHFTSTASGTITVNMTGHTGTGVQVLLYDQDFSMVQVDNTPPYAINYSAAPGKYSVRIYSAGGFNNTTPYTLKVTYP